ncbi:MAG: hypothetical protein ACJAR7_001451, partial [Polaromonas sp.]
PPQLSTITDCPIDSDIFVPGCVLRGQWVRRVETARSL